MISRRCCLALVAMLPLATAAAAAEPGIPVVATFSILADFVRQVGGDRVAVTVLVGPNGDAHVYSPTPADARSLAEARIVFANGLGFESWIARLVAASGTKAPLVETARGVAAIRIGGKADRHAHGHGHDHGANAVDPHAWQNVAHARTYVANIRDALAAADPAGRPAFEANAAAYLSRLDALDREVREAFAAIPAASRKVITAHDSFAYFAAAYGVAFIAPKGVSTDAEASAKDVARIVRQIKREKITAVFLESITDARLIQQIARETGSRIGGRLYSDALSEPGGPAPGYVEMIRSNTRALAAAFAPGV